MGSKVVRHGTIGHIVSKLTLPDPDRTGNWGGSDQEYKDGYVLWDIIVQPPYFTEQEGFLYIKRDRFASVIIILNISDEEAMLYTLKEETSVKIQQIGKNSSLVAYAIFSEKEEEEEECIRKYCLFYIYPNPDKT